MPILDLSQADVRLDSALRVRLSCSDLFFAESRLRSEHLGFLPRLQELSLQFCKLRQLPARAFVGLPALTR